MKSDFIRVTKRRDARWSVFRGQRNLCLLTFKRKVDAVAYARQIALNGGMVLFVDDRNGIAVRQASSSAVYPVFLH
jgi:hypothetical protein